MQQFDIVKNCFKRWMGLALILILSLDAYCQVFPKDTIMYNGRNTNRINIAYLADGYTQVQLDTFITNSIAINNAMFSQTPFAEYKNFFNSFAVKVPSNGSGAIHLNTAPDCPPLSTQPIDTPTTYFGSAFDESDIHRLLVAKNYGSINSILADNLPDFDQALVVVNSPYYGGSGGFYPATSTDASSAEIAVHEIGHSFGGLADEYWAGDFYAGEKPNMTADDNPATIKWKNWLGLNDIGIYVVGITGSGTTWYRPHQQCKMQFLGYSFCSVCSEALIDRIHQLVSTTDSILPAATSFTLLTTDSVDFSVKAIQNEPSSIGIKWYINGSEIPFAANQYKITLPFGSFTDGNNTVRAEVFDSTSLSKSFLPGIGYINNTTWDITKPAVLPVTLKAFTGKVSNDAGILNWEIEASADIAGFELEKSKDGISFSFLAGISAQQQTNYTYSDPALLVPHSYYRLKVTDKNGSYFYSAVLRLQIAFDKFYYKVYQQAEAKRYHLSIRLGQSQKIAVNIADGAGRKILRKYFGKVSTQLDADFNLEGKSAGLYYMTLTIDDKIYNITLLAR